MREPAIGSRGFVWPCSSSCLRSNSSCHLRPERIERTHSGIARKLRSGRARGNKIFRFVESKSLSQFVAKQQEIDAHLKNDRPNG